MEWFENSCNNDVIMVWLCWFWSSMNGWDLKYYIGIWKVEKNGWKKMKWNGIVWKIWKVEKNEKNKMGEMVIQTNFDLNILHAKFSFFLSKEFFKIN